MRSGRERGEEATMSDKTESALTPEVSVTPRDSRRKEKSAAEDNISTASAISSDAATALGSVLELTWLSVAGGDAPLPRSVDQNAPLELSLRWAVQESSRMRQRPQQSKRLSLPAKAVTREQWELPTGETSIRVELTPGLLQRLTDATNSSLLLLHVSLSPRRASSSAWSLRFCVAVDGEMLKQSSPDHALRVEAGVSNQDGRSAGVAALSLRCGQPSQLQVPPTETRTHDPQAVTVRLQLARFVRALENKTGSTTPMDVVLEASIPGQEASRAVRSKPWKLLKSCVDLSMETAMALVVDDTRLQAIHLVLYRHSTKERALRLAEALVSVQSLERSGDQQAVMPLLDSASIDSRGEDTPVVWGELTAKATVLRRGAESSSSDLVVSAATSVLGESKYEAELADVEGTLAIELIEATIETLASEYAEMRFSVDVQLRVPTSTWSSATSSVSAPVAGAKRSVSFKKERFRVPVQWAMKERVVPTFSCTLTLRCNAVDVVNGSSHRGKKASNDQAHSRSARGVHCIQLPVLFAFPNQWTAMELPVSLVVPDDPTASPILLRLRLRMQFVRGASGAANDAVEDSQGHGSGHLTLSNARAEGAFLRTHRPTDTYAITFETSSIGCGSATMVSVFADEKTASWDRSASCEIVKGSFAPIVVVRILRNHHLNGEENSELLGTLVIPLPSEVLDQKHLVSFTLPFTTEATGDRDRAALEGSSRRVGMISFDLQFVDDSPVTASRLTSSINLVFHRIVWTNTPAALALALSTTRSLMLQSSFSIVGGDSLNAMLWSHDTKDIQATKDHDVGEYVVDHAIRLTDATVAKLVVATASKSMLIIKLQSSDTGRDGERVVLGQAVIPIRGGWAAFADQEQCKWHKLYAVGRRESGNPEAIGEIQVSVVPKEESGGDGSSPRNSLVDGWLYVEILEAVWTNASSVSSTKVSAEAFVQLARVGSSRKPQNTKPQWSADGAWKWNGDGVLTVPHIKGEGDGEEEKYSLALVVSQERRLEVATLLDGMDCIQRSRSIGAFEDWLTTTDNDGHIRLRVFYLPAVAGSLKVDIRRIQSLLTVGSRAGDLSLQRIALRVAMEPSAETAGTEAKEGGTHSLRSLEGSHLELPIDTSSSAFASRGIPVVKLQLLGYAAGNHELCIGEGFVPITVLHTLFVQPTASSVTQWVTLHSRHDGTNRVAVILVGFQFLQGPDGGVKTHALAEVVSLDQWREVCAAVLTLWKKLFYAIDSDHNGRVELDEFKELFISHAQVFTHTDDGKMLMAVLFPQRHPQVDLPSIARLFDEMDVNGDKGIEWLEFVDFMRAKLLALKPQLQSQQMARAVTPWEIVSVVEPVSDLGGDAPTRELRKKRREDPHNSVVSSPPSTLLGAESKSSSKRLSVRQLSAAQSADRSNGVAPDNASTREETTQLHAKMESLETMLHLEKQKTSRLQDELRTLRRTTHQLQLQREREVLEQKTKAQFLEQAICSHEHALNERDVVRARQYTASIVLQSKVRMRLEQKKFQALKLLRWNAAVRIQCAYRCFVASTLYRTLRTAELWRRKRIASATRLQRFVRVNVRRKERLLHRQARELSAVVLQKHVRRWLAVIHKEKCVQATVKIQSWSRGRLAVRQAQRLRCSNDRLKHWILGRVHRRRWCRLRASVASVQRWWRRANELRWEYVTQLEAAMCIQAVWRGHHNRKRLREVLMDRRDKVRDGTAQLSLMASAMGEVEETAGPEEVKERDEDRSIDDQWLDCDTGGDESALPEDTLWGERGEEECELVDPETTPSATQEAEGGSVLSNADPEPEVSDTAAPTTIRDPEVVLVNEGIFDDPQREVADVLAALIDRVHVDASVEASSAHEPCVSVPADQEARESPSVDLSDTHALKHTAIARIQDDVEMVERVEAARAASAESEEKEVVRLVEELVERVGQLPIALDGEEEEMMSKAKEEVERVLRDLVETVSVQEDVVDQDAVDQDAEEELLWRDDHAGAEGAAPEALDSVRAEEDVDVVGAEKSHVDESRADEGATLMDTAMAHDERPGIDQDDAVEPLVLGEQDDSVPVADEQDVNSTDESSLVRGAVSEASEVQAEARVVSGVSSEAIAQETVESRPQGGEEIQAATEDPVVSTRMDLDLILASDLPSDQGERILVDVEADGGVAAVDAELQVADPENRAEDSSIVPHAAAEAVMTPFDVSESDDDDAREEEESSLDRGSSEANDDLLFMADADAVTHVENATLSEDDDDPLDDQDSRLASEREDSDQQLLMDFEELTQPAAASTQ